MGEDIEIQGNLDIQKALEEFEKKAATENVQGSPQILQTSEVPKMVQLVMKYSGGLIKEQRQAEYVLFGFVLITIIISLFLVFTSSSSSKTAHEAAPPREYRP